MSSFATHLWQFPSLVRFRILIQNFQTLHVVLHDIGIIDGSHIPILAHVIEGEFFCYSKLFHSALLQGIVDTKCVFWDYKFKWSGSTHD